MRKSNLILFVVLMLVLGALGSMSALSDEHVARVDWTNPESIDPLDPSIGDFLDVDINAMKKAASEFYQSGDYLDAARYYLLLARYDCNDSSAIYNLACCYGLMNKPDLASVYLKRAFNAGFKDIGQFRNDPDFLLVRENPQFDQTLNELETLVDQQQSSLGTTVAVESPAFFNCRVQVPADFDPNRSYPLIVGLHGHGASPDNFMGLWGKFDNPQFIFATPQAPYPMPLGRDIGYSWTAWSDSDPTLEGRSAEMTVDYVINVVNSLKKQYKVNKIYLLGFSQGAAFTYDVGIPNYRMFDGLIVFGGWLDPRITPAQLDAAKGLKVFIGHGTQDRMVEFTEGERARDTLKDAGYNVTFFQFDGPHRIPPEALLKVQDWLKPGTISQAEPQYHF